MHSALKADDWDLFLKEAFEPIVFTSIATLLILIVVVYTGQLKHYVTQFKVNAEGGISYLIWKKSLQTKKKEKIDHSLLSVDVQQISAVVDQFINVFFIPVQVLVVVIIEIVILGWESLIGTAFLLIITPLLIYFGKLNKKRQISINELRKQRITQTNNILDGIFLIKSQSLEQKATEIISKYRTKELQHQFKFNLTQYIISAFARSETLLVTFAFILLKIKIGDITLESVIMAQFLYTIQVTSFNVFPNLLNQFNQSKMCANNIETFLLEPDDIDQTIGFQKIQIQTTVNDFKLNVNAEINKNDQIAIVGPVGCGKSLLLQCFAGLVKNQTMKLSQSIAYFEQQPQLLNVSIIENIEFGKDHNEQQLRKIIDVCQLYDIPDLSKIITDLGNNISGGQKSRIQLARCLYQKPEVLLLDDIFESINESLSKIIMTKLFQFVNENQITLIMIVKTDLFKNQFPKVLEFNVKESCFEMIEQQPVKIDSDKEILKLDNQIQQVSSSNQGETLVQENQIQTKKDNIQTWKKIAQIPIILTALLILVLLGIVQLFIFVLTKYYKNVKQFSLINGVIVIISIILCVLYPVCYSIGLKKAGSQIYNINMLHMLQTTFENLSQNINKYKSLFSSIVSLMDTQLPNFFLMYLSYILQLLVTLIIQCFIQWWIVFIFVALGLLFIYILKKVEKVQNQFSDSRQSKFAEQVAYQTQILNLQKQIMLLPQQQQVNFYRKYQNLIESSQREFYVADLIPWWMEIRTMIIVQVFVCSVFWIVIFGSKSEQIADFVSFSLASIANLSWLVPTITSMYFVNKMFSQMVKSFENIQNDKMEETGNIQIDQFESIKLEHLDFGYNEMLTLKDINIKIIKNEKVAITGSTGSGKSTILMLILGLYRSELLLNNQKIYNIDMKHSRQKLFAMVTQKPITFGLTIREELKIFGATDQKVSEVLAQPLFQTLKEHLDESSSILTDGQKQLLCYCRALLKQAPILLLDEAGASLDNETAKIIQIDALKYKGTVIQIVHHELNEQFREIHIEAGEIEMK